jgi:hypothetical protein
MHIQPEREHLSEPKTNNYWLDDGQVKPLNIKTKLKGGQTLD